LQCVGKDKYGNKYYQDLAVDYGINKRFVEYADHYRYWKTADNIPPEWDGWLKGCYMDVPSVF
jgi:NADH:ubiquinone oxidoreductase subunit